MKPIPDNRFAAKLERVRHEDLDKIEQAGIPRIVLVGLLSIIASQTASMSQESIERFRDHKGKSRDAKAFFRKNFRKDHDQGQVLLVKSIKTFNPNFDSWAALSRVIEEVYILVGRERRQYLKDGKLKSADFASADQLIRIARGVTP